jgi:ribose transport system ATP-binding protein
MTPRFEMRGVRKRFGATLALDGVDFSVQPGEVHALLGQNGAGKSTLMKVLSGAHAPDEGTMAIDGVPYAPRVPLEARRAGVAMVYQELSLAPHLSVEENLLLGVEPARFGVVDRRAVRAKAREALEALGHADLAPDARVASLPIAQRQIVEVGRALAVGCRVLVLDEPTSSIGRADVEALFRLVGRLRDQGLAVVYISHFLEECRKVATRFTVLRDGRSAGGGDLGATPAGDLVRLMVGRLVEELYPRSPRTPGEAVLDLGPLKLRRGEVLGIAGLVGSGRTRLLRSAFEPARSWSRGVGFVSEDRKGEGLLLGLSVAENVTLTRLEAIAGPGAADRAAAGWIERLGLRCAGPRQRVAELSGGNQQKAAIARLLHHGVDVLLLDEPTKGIDVASKAEIYGLIDRLVSREGKSAVLVSSDFAELLGVCDRIAVLKRGELGAAREAAAWTEHDLVREAS